MIKEIKLRRQEGATTAVMLNWGRKGYFILPGNTWQNPETFLVVTRKRERAIGIYRVDTTKHPTMHKTTPKTKNYPAQNIKSAKVKKPRSRAKYDQILDFLCHLDFQAIH